MNNPKNQKTILALDLGTITGWALHYNNGSITSGTENFKMDKFEGGGMVFLCFRQWLVDLKNSEGGFDEVYFEAVRSHKGIDAAHKYGGFLATLTAFCEHHQIPYLGVPVGTIKKHITGKGNATKYAVIDAKAKVLVLIKFKEEIMKLLTWMNTHKLKTQETAKLFGVTYSHIYKYVYDKSIPKPPIMQKIACITCGAVTANDFNNITTEGIEKYWQEQEEKKETTNKED
ncbi:helix-turn-helix transcriptional regulator [Rickettsia endosymbiont of Orchestes rusci]|uniref:helix-turn-helix transcriptional regulator n=1 Tax=Rickettsia endosymbiont of Orchestes rusci TaxID=3066250 RepID=UPI00313EFA1E